MPWVAVFGHIRQKSIPFEPFQHCIGLQSTNIDQEEKFLRLSDNK